MDGAGGGGHFGAHRGARGLVLGDYEFCNARVGRGQRLARVAVEHRAQLGVAVVDGPRYATPCATLLKRQVDDAQVAAPEPRHRCGHAVDGAALQVDFRVAVEEAAREFAVRVAKQDGIHAGNFGQAGDGVFSEQHGFAALEPRMRDEHHHVGAVGLQARHQGVRSGHDVQGRYAAEQVLAVPLHHLRRCETGDCDLQRLRRSGLVDELTLKNHAGREHVLRRVPLAAAVVENDIGIEIRKLRTCQGLLQERQAVVEFVVADVRCVVIQRVHHFQGWVQLAWLQRLDAGHVVAQRVALQHVAVVEEQGVLRLCARRADERGGAVQAVVFHRLVLVIVPGQQVHVDVGGLQNAQLELLRPRRVRP